VVTSELDQFAPPELANSIDDFFGDHDDVVDTAAASNATATTAIRYHQTQLMRDRPDSEQQHSSTAAAAAAAAAVVSSDDDIGARRQVAPAASS
jgi:hypothetical protein